MEIVLISPGWTKVFGPFSRIGYQSSNFPPLGICYLAALARQKGHQVKLIDAEIEMLGTQQIVSIVKEFSPDMIGISSTTPMFHIAKELAARLREVSKAPILIGGPHISYFKEKEFDKNFDFLFIGESEKSFVQFLDCFENNRNFSSIKGIVFRDNGKPIFTGKPELIENLDELPFPARDLLPLNKFITRTVRHGKKNYTSILFSRGCPFKCIYCAAPELFGSKVRMSSVQRLVDEIEHLLNTSIITHFNFLDDNLTLSRKFVLDFCNEIKKRNLSFTWEGSTRADLIDEELVALMVKNGLIRISFALESADEEVRKIIKKEVPLEDLERANMITAKYGVETINSAMLGLPGETREKIRKTVEFLRNARTVQHATFSIAMPYPGTEFLRMAKKGEYGLKLHSEDFSKYQRYGSAVLTVNDMAPKEIIMLQKRGLLRIFLVPYRVRRIIRRFNFWSLIPPFISTLGALLVYSSTNFVKFLSRKARLR